MRLATNVNICSYFYNISASYLIFYPINNRSHSKKNTDQRVSMKQIQSQIFIKIATKHCHQILVKSNDIILILFTDLNTTVTITQKNVVLFIVNKNIKNNVTK